MHEALRYLPYLLIGTANPYKKRWHHDSHRSASNEENEKRNKIVATNQIAYYGELGLGILFDIKILDFSFSSFGLW